MIQFKFISERRKRLAYVQSSNDVEKGTWLEHREFFWCVFSGPDRMWQQYNICAVRKKN